MTTRQQSQQPPASENPGAPAEADPSTTTSSSSYPAATATHAPPSSSTTDAGGANDADAMDTAPGAPDSPPLPARHTAVTPGPRAARFQKVYAECLAHTLAKVSWDNFAACYPTIAAQAPGKLRHIQGQVVGRIADMCNRDFEAILRNREVVAKLNELESLSSEAARRRSAGGSPPVAPHLLPPDAVLAAHLAPHLAQHQSKLNAKLQTVQAHNEALWREVAAQRDEAERLMRQLEAAVADVEGAAGQLDGVVDELGRESRAVEVEMGGT